MVKGPKLHTGDGPIGRRVKTPALDENPQLSFSFKHLDLMGNAKFSLLHCSDTYLQKFLERLRDVSMMTLNDFRRPNNRLRSHRIDFAETSEDEGFVSLNPQLRESEPWQFQISSNEHGRLHGILLGATFYLIWVDPCHLLYSKQEWCDTHSRP